MTNQMKCAIGENLVCAQLIAHGWPTANVNSSIKNFKGIDLFCQYGDDVNKVLGIQVKTALKNTCFHVGFTNAQAADLDFLNSRIKGPWIFVFIKSLVPLDVDYYVVPRQALIDILYQGHDWYLNKWDRPATDTLKKGPAGISLKWLQGRTDTSKHSPIEFVSPYPGNIFSRPDAWANIWAEVE